MRFAQALRHLTSGLILAAVLGCGAYDATGPNAPVRPAPNFVRLNSDPNDAAGAGLTWEYSQTNAIITVTSYAAALSIDIHGDTRWFGNFQAPGSLAQLQPGTYTNLHRPIGNDRVNGGIDWSGNGHGCNTTTGAFTVDSVTYTAGVLSAMDMRFEQHCEDRPPALRGTIHWRSDDTTSPPGPVNPPPATLWRPAADATPPTGNYVYVEGEAGEPLAGARTYTYTQSTATILVGSSELGVGVSVNGTERWSGVFAPMYTLGQLAPGYYGNVGRWPFQNPTKGGLSWGRVDGGYACSAIIGWFVIDSVMWSGTTITALDLRFEQRCSDNAAKLHGAVHWVT